MAGGGGGDGAGGGGHDGESVHDQWLRLHSGGAGDTQAFDFDVHPASRNALHGTVGDDNDSGDDKDSGAAPLEIHSTDATPELEVFTLRAANQPALEALCRLREQISAQPPAPAYAHTRNFVRLEPPQTIQAALGLHEHRESSPWSTSSEEHATITSPAVLSPASFCVLLNTPPRIKAFGWSLGSSPETADLVLPARSQGCHSRHVTFRFNDTGQLTLVVLRNRVELDAVMLHRGDSRPLYKRSHVLQIGNLKFLWEIQRLPAHDSQYQVALVEYGKDIDVYPYSANSVTPQEHQSYADSYRLDGIVGAGSVQLAAEGRTVIHAATHIVTGRLYAIKARKRVDAMSRKDADMEIAIYTEITKMMPANHGPHDFVLRLHEVFPKPLQHERYNLVHLVFDPLAKGDLHHMTPYMTGDQLLIAIVQCLLGLRWLHSQGWVHRDIKPGNIGILTAPRIRAVILDLGQAYCIRQSGGLQPHAGNGGTVGYLAPEQENKKYCDPALQHRYDYRIDVFALGTIALDLLSQDLCSKLPASSQQHSSRSMYNWARNPNPFLPHLENSAPLADYKKAMKLLESFPKDSFASWIARMLQLFANQRFTSEQALEHPAISKIVKQEIDRMSALNNSSAVPGMKRTLPDGSE